MGRKKKNAIFENDFPKQPDFNPHDYFDNPPTYEPSLWREAFEEYRTSIGFSFSLNSLEISTEIEREEDIRLRDRFVYYGSAALVGILLRVFIKAGLL